MTTEDHLRRLDQLVETRSILFHPFYIAWRGGKLTREQLQTYARSYYPHVAAFPRYLASAAVRTSDSRIRATLEENLHDELFQPKAHSELWLDFAEGLGVDRAVVAAAAPPSAAAHLVSVFDRLSRNETIAGVAALYAYESQQPKVSEEKANGLRRHYGVVAPAALAYFHVHAEIDVHHRDTGRHILASSLAAGSSPAVMLASAEEALDAYWGLLDGIVDDAGVAIGA